MKARRLKYFSPPKLTTSKDLIMVNCDYDSQAPFYDEMMPRLSTSSEEIKIYADYLKDRPNILEFGCGTGRVTFPLSKSLVATGNLKSYLATDNSLEMLAKALEKKLQDPRTNETASVHFENLDAAQSVSELFTAKYDAVVAFCGLTSLLGKTRLPAFFKNASQSMTPGGLLIIDALDPTMIRASVEYVNGSFMRISNRSGLVSFTSVSDHRYDAEFVWVSERSAFRFREESELIEPETMDEIAMAEGLAIDDHMSAEITRRVSIVNGPSMYFKAYVKR